MRDKLHHSSRILSKPPATTSKAMAKSCHTGMSALHRNKEAEERSSPSQKVKRLKTRKERNQLRGPNISSFYRSHKHSRKLCCSHPLKHYETEKAIAKPFPTQKRSIITERRLTSIRGLFSHEVRSVDIERLVKEQERQDQGENHQGKATTSNSPSVPSHSPLIPRLASGEHDMPEGQRPKRPRNELMLNQTHHLNTYSEGPNSSTLYEGDDKHSSAQTSPEAVDNIGRSGSPKTRTETKILSLSSESELFQFFSTPKANHNVPNVTSELEDIFKSHDQEQINKAAAAMNEYQKLDNTPAKSVHLNLDATQYDPAPAKYNVPSPVLDKERSALADEGQSKKSGASMENKAVSRLAARLCQTLDFPPLQRPCPLLTECREVLLQTLQERNSCMVHPLPGVELSHITDQALSSSGQEHEDCTSMHFSFTRKYEDDKHKKTMQNQEGSSSWRELLGEDFCQDAEKGAAGGKWSRQTWAPNLPLDFFSRDMLGQCSARMSPQESLRAKQHSNSPAISLHQAFTRTEVPTAYSYNFSSDPFFLQPQRQAKLDISKNSLREVTELLDQWSSDPDLGFLFRENMRRTHAVGPMTKDWSHQQMESTSKRSPFGSSSTVLGFFSPKCFRYEPYYRFPHPFNSISKSERSGMTLYNHSDVKDLGLSPSLPLTVPYFRYLPSV